MNSDAREVARIIRRIEANMLGILGEILARPEYRRRLLHTVARGPARQKLKRQLAAFERFIKTVRRHGGAAGTGQTQSRRHNHKE